MITIISSVGTNIGLVTWLVMVVRIAVKAAGLRGEIGTVDKPVESSKTLNYGPFEGSHRGRDARVQKLWGPKAQH